MGGGLFLLVVLVGVLFWISREREEDHERREQAELLNRGRRKRFIIH